MSRAFGKEFGEKTEELLVKRCTKVITGKAVNEIIGKGGKVSSVVFQSREEIETDAVILSMAYVPNATLAKKSGLELNKFGFIKTCEYMRVENFSNEIFAVGDCAEKRDFLTKRLSTTMLASTVCAEARVAGMNLYELSPYKVFGGTIAIYNTAIGDSAFGTAGITKERAIQDNLDVVFIIVVVGSFTSIDKHLATLEGTHEQTVKLIVAGDCGMIIGGISIGELTNTLGF